jgi:hypothetical protein
VNVTIQKDMAQKELAQKETISLTVWNVPMPVIAGEPFAIKVGARSSSGRALPGCRVEVSDAAGSVTASGALGNTPWAGSEALYWVALDVPAPRAGQMADYTVRCVPTETASEAVPTRFNVTATERPECTLSVKVSERNTAEPLDGVEVRLGPFHARTDASGHAELRVNKGEYQLHLWRIGHIASPEAIRIDSDTRIALTMLHVPEEHPDARWVR